MTRAALRYAKATLSFATEQSKENQVNEEMLLIAKTIDKSKDLQALLNNPVLKSEIKKATLQNIFKEKITDISYKLIDVLIENKRLSILGAVAQKYTIIFDSLKGKDIAKVTTAVPLTEALEAKILQKVKEITGKEATLKNTINPDIIGGFILRIGDIQYDASIINKLSTLKRKFNNEAYVS